MDNPNTISDSRGTIKDLLVTDDYSVTHITFNKDAVRGNHYHKETIQGDIVIKGSLLCFQDDKKQTVNIGDVVSHLAGVKHAYKALEDSEIISICFVKRRGEHYEEDTFRLPENEKLV
jgi:quercetin dioxygenase-like cupin family protein